MNINEQANFIWSIADLLRGDFKQSEYGKVILPFTVLRRFDCVLAPSKAKDPGSKQNADCQQQTTHFQAYDRSRLLQHQPVRF